MENVKIAFVSLGCDKNLMDSEIMLGLINEKGYTITQQEELANVIIINSCGFKLDASEEGIANILRVADYKITGKCKALIVTGCMAQRYKEQIFDELPEVDAVVGTGDFENIGSVISELLQKNDKITLITDKDKVLDENNSLKRIVTTIGGFAYLKIAEGCDKHCTYCTIPSLRGKYRSRTIESLIKEAQLLVNQEVKEIILVAQDTSLYGTDLYGKPKLVELLQELSKIEDLRWIRILYCYPEHITDELIDEIAVNPKVCNYIDMPIQHSSDKILKLMGRQSTQANLENIINKIRTKIPNICIRTTFIVGFPNETEEDFQDLYEFVERIKFDRLGVFTYSKEEGTPSFNMPNHIEEKVKLERNDKLLTLQKDISCAICESFVGQTLEVIIEGKLDEEDTEDTVYCARSYRDCYEVDCFVFFKVENNLELLAGDFVNVKITGACDYDLMGVLC